MNRCRDYCDRHSFNTNFWRFLKNLAEILTKSVEELLDLASIYYLMLVMDLRECIWLTQLTRWTLCKYKIFCGMPFYSLNVLHFLLKLPTMKTERTQEGCSGYLDSSVQLCLTEKIWKIQGLWHIVTFEKLRKMSIL